VLKWTNNICTLYKSDSRTIPVPDKSIHTVCTSPPYWGLRDYGTDEQIGLEPTPEEYCANMVAVFREVRRVLRDDGTVWLNLGDSYSSGSRTTTTNDSFRGDTLVNTTRTPVVEGIKPKDLVGIPWRVAFALQSDGWYLRSDIIWSKPNPMPESVTDRPTKAHEYIFLLTKNEQYYYDADAIREQSSTGKHTRIRSSNFKKQSQIDGRYVGGGRAETIYLDEMRNKRSVWEISSHPYPEAHFATYPEKLVEPCILAGCPTGGTVLDPFVGSGTTLAVAQRLGRKGVGTDINDEYLELAQKRLSKISMPMF